MGRGGDECEGRDPSRPSVLVRNPLEPHSRGGQTRERVLVALEIPMSAEVACGVREGLGARTGVYATSNIAVTWNWAECALVCLPRVPGKSLKRATSLRLSRRIPNISIFHNRNNLF